MIITAWSSVRIFGLLGLSEQTSSLYIFLFGWNCNIGYKVTVKLGDYAKVWGNYGLLKTTAIGLGPI